MTVALKTLIDRSLKNMGAVRSDVKDRAIEIIRRAYDEGIYVQMTSGFRSFEEQAALYGQGRKSYQYKGKEYGRLYDRNGKKLPIVTQAAPGQSIHNYGLAVDYVLVSPDGSRAIWSVNKQWRRVAQIGKSLGFEWGGDWTSFVDAPHLQYTQGLTLSQLRGGKRPALMAFKSVAEAAKPTPSKGVDGILAYLFSNPNSSTLNEEGLKEIKDWCDEKIHGKQALHEKWYNYAKAGKLSVEDGFALLLTAKRRGLFKI